MSTEIQAKVYKDISDVADPLALAILDRTIRDCVYLRRREVKSFITVKETSKTASLNVLNREKKEMRGFIESEFFSSLCELIGQDDYMMKSKILKILRNNEAAKLAAEALGMKFIFSTALIIILAIIPTYNTCAQPFLPLSFFEPLPTTPVVEVTILDSVHATKIPVKCHGSTNFYRVPVYTYLTPSGAKVSYPFLVKFSDKAKHPLTAKVKLWGHKLMIFAPFISLAGSVAQILLCFK